MASAPGLLAHQGGWDELLFVLVPIAVVIGLLAVIKRRVERTGPVMPAERAVSASPTDDGPPASA